MIFGTAGHIDHGKSTLVKALTGVDPDRLQEEKARGITVDLGYAYTEIEGRRIGFVDVPGHERLVRNMLAGATGIDRVILVVAADDGVMPQTREHLAIVSLLGLDHGCVVITKRDRVDAARLLEVDDEVRALLAGSLLHDAPRLPVSAVSGEGLPALRDWLFAQAGQSGPRDHDALFRMPIDRAFTIAGAGLVVTGTVHAGRVTIGDEIRIGPADRVARVRGIHALGAPATEALAGVRCALNLTGDIDREAIERGHWAVAPAACMPTARIDVELQLLAGETRPLRHWTQVHAHLGAADLSARVAVLNPQGLIEPGTSELAQLVFERPTLAAWGDRIVLRDQSALRTIGGARVLDIKPPVRRRRVPARLAVLAALRDPATPSRLDALLALSREGVAERELAAAWGLPAARLAACAQALGAVGVPVGSDRRLYAAVHWQARGQALREALADWHRQHPDDEGIERERLRRSIDAQTDPLIFQQLLNEAAIAGDVVIKGSVLRLAAHRVQLGEREQLFRQRALPAIVDGGFDPPWMRDLARAQRLDEQTARHYLKRLARSGELVEVLPDLFYAQTMLTRLMQIALAIEASDGVIETPRFRDQVNLGRKRAIQILEWFDSVGFTRRSGDQRWVRPGNPLLIAHLPDKVASPSTQVPS